MKSDTRDEVVWRLNTAVGHLHAIGDLIETCMPYRDVVHQLIAVKTALRVASNRLLACQLQQSEEILLSGSEAGHRAELSRLQELYELSLRQHGNETEGQHDDL